MEDTGFLPVGFKVGFLDSWVSSPSPCTHLLNPETSPCPSLLPSPEN